MAILPSRRAFLAGTATSLLSPQATAIGASGDSPQSESASIGFHQAATGALSRTVESKLRDIISVKDFGASGDGITDDTAAFQAAIDVANSFAGTQTSLFIPPGNYRITDQIRIDKNHIRLFGAGDKSCLYFDPSGSGKAMIVVQNRDPARLISYVALEHFGFRARYPAPPALSKTGIRLVDASTVTIRNVNVLDNSWVGGSGKGSIALHMCGRDTHNILECILKADSPIYADRNPNSTTFSFDFQSFSGLWLETLKASNYAITFAPGVNPSNWIVDGNCGAFRGKGGIYLNNQGTVTETSSMLRISHFRCESGTNSGGEAGGYGIFMDFGNANPACGNMVIDNFSASDPTCHGISLNRVTSLSIKNVNVGFGASNNAFILSNVNNAHIVSLGIGNASATVKLNNMSAQRVHLLSNAAPGDKSIAFGVYSYNLADTPVGNLVYEQGVRIWRCNQSLANAAVMTLPVLAAGESMMVRVTCNSGGAVYNVTCTAVEKLSGSAGFTTNGTGTVSVRSDGAGNNTLTNVAGGLQTFRVMTEGS